MNVPKPEQIYDALRLTYIVGKDWDDFTEKYKLNPITTLEYALEAKGARIKGLEVALGKLSQQDFDWSTDCGGQLPYDEWVLHIAQAALAAKE